MLLQIFAGPLDATEANFGFHSHFGQRKGQSFLGTAHPAKTRINAGNRQVTILFECVKVLPLPSLSSKIQENIINYRILSSAGLPYTDLNIQEPTRATTFSPRLYEDIKLQISIIFRRHGRIST